MFNYAVMYLFAYIAKLPGWLYTINSHAGIIVHANGIRITLCVLFRRVLIPQCYFFLSVNTAVGMSNQI